MKLTGAEEAQARQVAAETGADPDAVITGGEQAKTEAAAQALAAAQGTMARMGGGQMMPGAGPEPAEVEAEAG